MAADQEPMTQNPNDPHTLARWRLVLGRTAEQHGIGCGGDEDAERAERLVGFLFEPGGDGSGSGQGRGRRGGRAGGRSSSREGGQGGPQLTVPDWVDQVNELFPNSVKEVMQKELVKRR